MDEKLAFIQKYKKAATISGHCFFTSIVEYFYPIKPETKSF